MCRQYGVFWPLQGPVSGERSTREHRDGHMKGRCVSDPCAILTVRCSARAPRPRGRAVRCAPRRARRLRSTPHGAPCWRGEVRSARRKGWTAAHAPLRRAVRSAAAHAARHALSTSRSVLHTDHLRSAPAYRSYPLPPKPERSSGAMHGRRHGRRRCSSASGFPEKGKRPNHGRRGSCHAS